MKEGQLFYNPSNLFNLNDAGDHYSEENNDNQDNQDNQDNGASGNSDSPVVQNEMANGTPDGTMDDTSRALTDAFDDAFDNDDDDNTEDLYDLPRAAHGVTKGGDNQNDSVKDEDVNQLKKDTEYHKNIEIKHPFFDVESFINK